VARPQCYVDHGGDIRRLLVTIFLGHLGDHMESSQLSITPDWVQRLLVALSFIPPMLNPLLCTLVKKDFRQAVKEVVFRRKDLQQHQDGMSSQRSTATEL